MKAQWDVVVIGGGPAGMTAAARAAERGRRVLLLEQNDTLGKKLLITGGGRCNVTNATTDRHTLVSRYGPQGVHLHSLFARFGPGDTRELLQRFGLETKVEAEGRVFPVTDSAASVRDVLVAYMGEGGVTVRRGCRVTGLVVEAAARESAAPEPAALDPAAPVPSGAPRPDQPARKIRAVRTSRGEEITASEFVLATGGTARPETGSRGDAFAWLAELGVPLRLVESALVPIRVPDQWVRSLQGLALTDAELVVQSSSTEATSSHGTDWSNARRLLTRRGKLLFTHFGLSGPLALNAASEIRELSRGNRIRLLVNPLPGSDPAAMDRLITDAAATGGKRGIGKLLRDLVAPRMADAVCGLAGVDPADRVATLSRGARRALVVTLLGMPCAFGGLMGQDKAIVSSGGVDPAAVDFRTMRLREISNLYVLGDLLDFNRQSGGYSLQMCWAGGWVAGSAAGSATGGNT
ncbi:MAG: FAD-dependent oxidoreductase [Spirochaetaceae bacterium]|nr:MAG: FAD-dependent oxidoreductase [Spirochaetaceae bacterium]